MMNIAGCENSNRSQDVYEFNRLGIGFEKMILEVGAVVKNGPQQANIQILCTNARPRQKCEQEKYESFAYLHLVMSRKSKPNQIRPLRSVSKTPTQRFEQ